MLDLHALMFRVGSCQGPSPGWRIHTHTDNVSNNSKQVIWMSASLPVTVAMEQRDRVKGCCHKLLSVGIPAISFCLHNALIQFAHHQIALINLNLMNHFQCMHKIGLSHIPGCYAHNVYPHMDWIYVLWYPSNHCITLQLEVSTVKTCVVSSQAV